tara:strand:+ start:2014 stop:2295 length:282 start_codon:yes stop_codon:yes gene_type:complete
MKITKQQLKEIIKEELEEVQETKWYDIAAGERPPTHSTGDVESLTLVQKIENSYHDLQDSFSDIEDVDQRTQADAIISDLQTLMDIMDDPEDY